eukprot:1684933-Amphidinium_carterae.1
MNKCSRFSGRGGIKVEMTAAPEVDERPLPPELRRQSLSKTQERHTSCYRFRLWIEVPEGQGPT